MNVNSLQLTNSSTKCFFNKNSEFLCYCCSMLYAVRVRRTQFIKLFCIFLWIVSHERAKTWCRNQSRLQKALKSSNTQAALVTSTPDEWKNWFCCSSIVFVFVSVFMDDIGNIEYIGWNGFFPLNHYIYSSSSKCKISVTHNISTFSNVLGIDIFFACSCIPRKNSAAINNLHFFKNIFIFCSEFYQMIWIICFCFSYFARKLWSRLYEDSNLKDHYTALLGVPKASRLDEGIYTCQVNKIIK